MLGVGGVGLFCGRGHLQIREIKGNQGKSKGNQEVSREIKGDQEESREIKSREIKRSQGDQCEPRKNEMK
nr:MAG TPA: hypothetical protein [Caudoviricetes sp.]